MIEAIRDVATGKPYTGPRMARALRNGSLLGRIELSDREKQVPIAWIQTEGKDEAGKRLFITPTTVGTHLQRARAKYATVGRPASIKSALLARAIEDGVLSLETCEIPTFLGPWRTRRTNVRMLVDGLFPS